MTNVLGDLISKGEGDYNSYNKGTARGRIVGADQPIDLGQMTIAEIMRRQSLAPGDPDRLFAVGKYQVIPDTMRTTIRELGVDPAEKYTPENQEKMFADHLIKVKRPNIYKYIAGEQGATLRGAQKAACLEWASVEDPDNPGHAYALYERHGNAMHTTAAQVAVALDAMREQYKASIEKGMSPDAAWQHVAVGEASATQWKGIPYAISDPRPLGLGDRNNDVRALQEHLNRLGVTDAQGRVIDADAQYGRNTHDAVAAFQRQHGILPSGIADAATLIAVQVSVNVAGPFHEMQTFQPPGARNDWMQTDDHGLPNYLRGAGVPLHERHTREASADGVLKIGERGPEVAKLQESLIQLGINDHVKIPIKPDGVFGPDTQRAVQAFQLWHGTEQVDGIADRQTLIAINTQAGLALIQRATDQLQDLPTRDFAANVNLGAKIDPQAGADARGPDGISNAATPALSEPAPVTEPAQRESASDVSQLSSEDLAMFAKIRAGAAGAVSDETVAWAMLAAKRNGIPDADRVGPIGVADGMLWVGGTVPGYHTGVSATQPPPAMQDTLRETQAFNRQRDQQATQRSPDDPSQGPRM
ncbi:MULTISPECIES: peptidoglycan-binding domain-containing protein [unclassified Lysobacter]|uniref:peptidoglycan-binding domain-containing protein n=1 Tax=unclassified Lysobacter TaxID=2635362 RepID=UPI001BEA90CF|nr:MULTISPECIES: peptidoglycan-binding domain-containing protein [unclassified Lysobacter]MBT2747131.1 peptidoglycan-binding protein [Lysobacter sp. ISL-42]MBT2752937.1 peptidoglycan-binding protein [Lysobacter sp. ISL-50]MBT2778902.1 peptidoglycan-binding protein [Lysobacter sp. ISL-54]MBT2784204.1 peptidoglycan-binding protein [Lysobacter sp. ISL-52]